MTGNTTHVKDGWPSVLTGLTTSNPREGRLAKCAHGLDSLEHIVWVSYHYLRVRGAEGVHAGQLEGQLAAVHRVERAVRQRYPHALQPQS